MRKKNYCLDCGKEIDHRSSFCRSCKQKGKRNHRYKNGYPKCIDCGKSLKHYKSVRCRACANKKHSEDLKNKNLSGENNPRWNGGKPKCIDCGKQLNYYSVKRCSNCYKKYQFLLIGEKNPNFRNRGKESKLYGNKRPEHSKLMSGKGNPNWKDGISKLPYSFDFNKELKAEIRERDGYICQNCFLEETNNIINEKQINLTVHHIDYNKENCKKENLITLCAKCNTKANFNRDYWYAFYKYIIDNKLYKENIKWQI